LEHVTLMLLEATRPVADELTVPKSMLEALPAVTEQALATVIRTWKVEVLWAAITALVAVIARTEARRREGFFMVDANSCEENDGRTGADGAVYCRG
jgi:hypothetical protein